MLHVYKTGYRANDPYTTYHDLGSPAQLTRQQVALIRQKNNDTPIIRRTITVGADRSYSETFGLRENDVFLITINKL